MRPFEGLRVLDLTHIFAGPFSTYQLAVLGAEVIKIEPVNNPDIMRIAGADRALNDEGYGLAFQAQSAGKLAIALNLKDPDGRAIFYDLVKTSDVVVQNYTTGCLAQLGLEYDTLKALNPRLIYCSISGFGRTGPKADDPAYDVVIQAFTGVMASNGDADAPPVRIGPPVIDYGTGAQAAMAISAALYGRERTGEGRYIDVAMSDAALMLMTMNVVTAAGTGKAPITHGNQEPTNAGYSAYDTADGMIMLGAYTAKQYAGLMQVLGYNDIASQVLQGGQDKLAARRDHDAVLMSKALKEKSADDWENLLNAHHVPAARVRTLDEALAHPQFASRSVLQSIEGLTGNRPVAAFSYDQGGPAPGQPPPRFAADTHDILQELGIDDNRLADLGRRGVIAV
jgi:crotonobetainyl-CoA:carnitine CoA-transferase CaiB-like acyl-CoA transferase